MCVDSTCFLTGTDLNFLLVLLNSKLGKFLLQDSPKTGTGDLLISVQALEPLMIATCNKINHFNEVYKKLYFDPTVEKELSNIIYKSYNLNTQEINYIMNF